MAKRRKPKILVPNQKPFKKLKGRKSLLKRAKGKKKKSTRWKKIGRYFGYGGLAALLITAITFAWFSKDLPTAGKIKNRKIEQSTKILDRDGNLLYQVHGEKNRILIDFDEIPDNVKEATIAIEDKNFYRHHGVDFSGIARAIWVNISRRGIYQGGSTLTQQLVKNALLSPKRTFSRKIKEIILSIEMEIIYSKDEILGMYLNEIPYGSNAYGIEAASETFFNKHAKNLTLAEASALASLPRAPTFYSPYGSHTDRLLARRNLVLDQMAEQGYIDKKKAKKIKKTKLSFSPKKGDFKAPHFVMYVKELVAAEYGERMVEEGGLTITTTLNQKIQEIADRAVKEGANRNNALYGGRNAALTAVDPKTGQILAMVGSKDFFDLKNDGNVNVALRNRQPGSAFKPVVYATLLKGQWSPGHTLFDLLTDFGGGYKPKNYDYRTRGPVSIRTALANSLNIPAVKALYLAGLNESIKTASDMGITTLTEPKRYGLSLVLGGGEVKLLELTGAYAVLANQGVRANLTPIIKIEDSRGKILKDNSKPKTVSVLRKEISYEISDILSDVNARRPVFGFSSNMSLPDRKVAVKTGTTTNYRDAWTVGYTPNIAAGVWAGNNDNSAMRGEAAGSLVAAPIWHQFMSEATRKFPIKDFTKPDGIKQISIAVLSNKKPTNSSWRVNTDIATDWQTPQDYDNTFQRVKIDKLSGKLATDYCPKSLVVEKTYGVIHSELPNNPNWENPVRGWARSIGIVASYPPTEKCDIHTPGNKPTVTIASPNEGDTVTGTITISATVNAPLGVKKVDFYLDNSSIGSDSSSPFSIDLDLSLFDSGPHTITVKVVDKGQLTAETSISITIGAVEGEHTPPEPENETN